MHGKIIFRSGAICKSRNAESGNRIREMMGMQGITVGCVESGWEGGESGSEFGE